MAAWGTFSPGKSGVESLKYCNKFSYLCTSSWMFDASAGIGLGSGLQSFITIESLKVSK